MFGRFVLVSLEDLGDNAAVAYVDLVVRGYNNGCGGDSGFRCGIGLTVEPISVATLVLAGVAVFVAVFWIAVSDVTAGTIAVDDDPMCRCVPRR